jgi:hypothetical protein
MVLFYNLPVVFLFLKFERYIFQKNCEKVSPLYTC